MRNTNGQLVCTEDNLVQTPYGLLFTELKKGESLSLNQIRFLEDVSYALDESKPFKPINSSESELIDFIQLHGVDEFIHSLKLIHDLALYHSDIPFDEDEKFALYNLKVLWEGLEQMEEKN